MPRIFCPPHLRAQQTLALSAQAARHVQVLRMQPGQALTLFDGQGGEYAAQIMRISAHGVHVQVGEHHAVEREAATDVHLALGMPANDRMDWLVEKATELGVASITPLMTQRAVLRLYGERAQRKIAHWQSIAIAACQQCGRNRIPVLRPIQTLDEWLSQAAALAPGATRVVLGFAASAARMRRATSPLIVLSGPEGGLTDAEESAAVDAGFALRSLGPRVLRAETAALAALMCATYPGECFA